MIRQKPQGNTFFIVTVTAQFYEAGRASLQVIYNYKRIKPIDFEAGWIKN